MNNGANLRGFFANPRAMRTRYQIALDLKTGMHISRVKVDAENGSYSQGQEQKCIVLGFVCQQERCAAKKA